MSRSNSFLPPEISKISQQSQRFKSQFQSQLLTLEQNKDVGVEQILDLYHVPVLDASNRKALADTFQEREELVKELGERAVHISDQLASATLDMLDPVRGVSRQLQACDEEYLAFLERLEDTEKLKVNLDCASLALDHCMNGTKALISSDFRRALHSLIHLVKLNQAQIPSESGAKRTESSNDDVNPSDPVLSSLCERLNRNIGSTLTHLIKNKFLQIDTLTSDASSNDQVALPEMPDSIKILEPAWSANVTRESLHEDLNLSSRRYKGHELAARWSIFSRSKPELRVKVASQYQIEAQNENIPISKVLQAYELYIQVNQSIPNIQEKDQLKVKQLLEPSLHTAFNALALSISYHVIHSISSPDIAVALNEFDVAAMRGLFGGISTSKAKQLENVKMYIPKISVEPMKTNGLRSDDKPLNMFSSIQLSFEELPRDKVSLLLPCHLVALFDLAIAFIESIPQIQTQPDRKQIWLSSASVWSPPHPLTFLQSGSVNSFSSQLIQTLFNRITRISKMSDEALATVVSPFASEIIDKLHMILRYIILPGLISSLRCERGVVSGLALKSVKSLEAVLSRDESIELNKEHSIVNYIQSFPTLCEKRYSAVWLEEARAIILARTPQDSILLSDLPSMNSSKISPISESKFQILTESKQNSRAHAAILSTEKQLNQIASYALASFSQRNVSGTISESILDLVSLIHKLSLDACIAADFNLNETVKATDIQDAFLDLSSALSLLFDIGSLFMTLSSQSFSQGGGYHVPMIAVMSHCDSAYLRAFIDAFGSNILNRMAISRSHLKHEQLRNNVNQTQVSLQRHLISLSQRLNSSSQVALLPALSEGWKLLAGIMGLRPERMITAYRLLQAKKRKEPIEADEDVFWFTPSVIRFLSSEIGELAFPSSDYGPSQSVNASRSQASTTLPLSFNVIERDVQDALVAIDEYLSILEELVGSWTSASLASRRIGRDIILRAGACLAEAIVGRALRRTELSMSASEAISHLLKRLLRNGLSLDRILSQSSKVCLDEETWAEEDPQLSSEKSSYSCASDSTSSDDSDEFSNMVTLSLEADVELEGDAANVLRQKLSQKGEESKVTSLHIWKNRSWLRARGLYEMLREEHTLKSLQEEFSKGELGRLFHLSEAKHVIRAVFEPSEKRDSCLRFLESLYEGPF